MACPIERVVNIHEQQADGCRDKLSQELDVDEDEQEEYDATHWCPLTDHGVPVDPLRRAPVLFALALERAAQMRHLWTT